jgi:hypothetical protein
MKKKRGIRSTDTKISPLRGENIQRMIEKMNGETTIRRKGRKREKNQKKKKRSVGVALLPSANHIRLNKTAPNATNTPKITNRIAKEAARRPSISESLTKKGGSSAKDKIMVKMRRRKTK